MNKELSRRVGAIMLTETIQSMSTAAKQAWLLSIEQAVSFNNLQGSPKELLLKAEASNG